MSGVVDFLWAEKIFLTLLSFGSGRMVIVSAVAKTWVNHFYLHMVINY